MGYRNARPAVFVALAVAISFVEPAAAQSVNRQLIDELNTQLLYVALPLTVFVEVILLYAVLRFSGNESPRPTIEDPPLEITWTVATAIILLFVGVSAYVVLATPYVAPDPAVATGGESADTRIQALSYQWGWQFTYPDANVTTQDAVVVPAERNVTFRITSADVLHSFYVPELGLKQDAFPGEYTISRTYVTDRGTYQAYCAELCGVGHSRMGADVHVVDSATYQQWLREHEGQDNVSAIDLPRS